MTICAGVYVPMSDALDSLLLPEDLWGSEPERAIALVTVREIILKRGGALIGDDVKRIAGSYNTRFKRLNFLFLAVISTHEYFYRQLIEEITLSMTLRYKVHLCGAYHLERATLLSIILTTRNCTGEFSLPVLDCYISVLLHVLFTGTAQLPGAASSSKPISASNTLD